MDSGCAEFRFAQQIARREVLRVGGLCGLGLSLPGLLKAREQSAVAGRGSYGKARQVIMLYLHGGHPQQETFDPKPNGPSAVRGEFGAIATSVPGVQFSELLPRTAGLMHKLAVVRSMSHSNANHVTASLPANSGHKHPAGTKNTDFPPAETDFPPFGAVLDSIRPSVGNLPTWVRIGPLMRRNNGTVLHGQVPVLHGQVPGFLGAGHAPFIVDQKLLDKQVEIEAIRPQQDLSAMRLSGRRRLLKQFDKYRQLVDESQEAQSLDKFYQKAFGLLASSRTRKAFDLSAESQQTRDRYGRTEFGQRCLLARRLSEAGVPMTNVSFCHTPRGSWDTHSGNFSKMKSSLAPALDMALGALIEDLEVRGRLDETLVIVNAEFGRTPKINRSAGRDHWPWVYSLVMAGAGIRGGTVYGSSDESAAYPTENPHEQKDFAASIYHLLGVPPETILYDKTNRPHHLVIGRPISGIIA